MIYLLVPIAAVAFFLGFYLRLVLHILVDMLNALQGLKNRQETTVQQQQLNQQTETSAPMEFVEPQTLAEYEAEQAAEEIRLRNRRANLQ